MIGILIAIVIVGAALYLIDAYVPMPAPIKVVVRVVGVIIIVIYLLRLAGLMPSG